MRYGIGFNRYLIPINIFLTFLLEKVKFVCLSVISLSCLPFLVILEGFLEIHNRLILSLKCFD